MKKMSQNDGKIRQQKLAAWCRWGKHCAELSNEQTLGAAV